MSISRTNPRPRTGDGGERAESGPGRRTLGWTIAGVLVAAVGVGVALHTGGPGNDGTVTTIRGDHNTVTNYQQFLDRIDRIHDPAAVRAAARPYAGVRPTGTGPWPFVVTDVGDLGLQVRSSGRAQADQVGSAGDGGTLWVECVADTGFAPSGGGDSLWARVRWPHRGHTTEYFNSAPAALYTAWAYADYLVPAGHNGAVPGCAG
jgi:hypothetical protein